MWGWPGDASGGWVYHLLNRAVAWATLFDNQARLVARSPDCATSADRRSVPAPAPTEGLHPPSQRPIRVMNAMETYDRAGGTIRRPCLNAGREWSV
jgi:hypothetical protein